MQTSNNKKQTDFVSDAARRAAIDVLLDRTVFGVGPKAYREFLARLDAPPRPNARLQRALQTVMPWEKTEGILSCQPLAESHQFGDLDSGEPSLDDWLWRRARANQVKCASRTYVVCCGKTVIGYYALTSGILTVNSSPGRYQREMRGRSPTLVAVLARLAVDRKWQGRGIGRALFRDAMERVALTADAVGIHAIVANAISEQAKRFYIALGFDPSPREQMTLVMPNVQEAIGKIPTGKLILKSGDPQPLCNVLAYHDMSLLHRIKAIKIKQLPTWGWDIGFGKYRYSVEVWGVLGNEESHLLFDCFRDELPPWTDQLIGLTVDQAKSAQFCPPSKIREMEARANMVNEMAAARQVRYLEEIVDSGRPCLPVRPPRPPITERLESTVERVPKRQIKLR